MLPEDGSVGNAVLVAQGAFGDETRVAEVGQVEGDDVALAAGAEGHDVAVEGGHAGEVGGIGGDEEGRGVLFEGLGIQDQQLVAVGGEGLAAEGEVGGVVMVASGGGQRADEQPRGIAIEVDEVLGVAVVAGDDAVDVGVDEIVVIEDADIGVAEDGFGVVDVGEVEEEEIGAAAVPGEIAAVFVEVDDLRPFVAEGLAVVQAQGGLEVGAEVVDADAVFAFSDEQSFIVEGDVVGAFGGQGLDDFGAVVGGEAAEFDAGVRAGERGEPEGFADGGAADLEAVGDIIAGEAGHVWDGRLGGQFHGRRGWREVA